MTASPVPAATLSVPEWLDVAADYAVKQQQVLRVLAAKSRNLQPASGLCDWQQPLADYLAHVFQDPEPFLQAQFDLLQQHRQLLQNLSLKLQGREAATVAPIDAADRRFRDERWRTLPMFDYLRQSYLLASNWWLQQVANDTKLPAAQCKKLTFFLRQMLEAASPSNFWATNPEVLEATLQSQGRNLVKGLENLLYDLQQPHAVPRVSMVKAGVFEVGQNLAMTPGQVMFENDVLQVIQYAPLTDTVFRTPLVIVSPWINKYYILDMQAENSFVRWCVAQGHTVFVTSWNNPDAAQRDLDWEDYAEDGLMAAVRTAQQATGEHDVNVIGYCIGGTLLATQLAYMAAVKAKPVVKSATFFTALIDFADSGELTLFTDDKQITAIEQLMAQTGYLDGSHMSMTFNLLRPHDLIWSFAVNNYLLGREPLPFDLLHWNSDSVRIPARLHGTYLRQMYLHNNLARGEFLFRGHKLDVAKVTTPSHFISAIEDHIAPWHATYRSARLLGGPVTFTLAGSGHIAGVINAPHKNKYQHWTNPKLAAKPEDWLDKATPHAGSWWQAWAGWVAQYGGDKMPARQPGDGALRPIEDAPGRYVLKK